LKVFKNHITSENGQTALKEYDQQLNAVSRDVAAEKDNNLKAKPPANGRVALTVTGHRKGSSESACPRLPAPGDRPSRYQAGGGRPGCPLLPVNP
jgi:hypothetical protein